MPTEPCGGLLVVGAGGYLGSTTAAIAAADGWEVSGWQSSRDDAEIWLARVAAGEFTAVINTAAAKFRAPESVELPRYWASNVELPYRISEAARVGDAALIHVGTRWTLGERGEGPNCLYAATKGFGDQLVTSSWAEQLETRVAVVRVRDLVGPHDPRSNIPRLLNIASSTGAELRMTKGDQMMDPIDVRDVATGLLRTIADFGASSAPPVFSEVGVQPITVREFVAQWQEATDRHVDVAWSALPYRGTELFAIEQVHPALPRFEARARHLTLRDTLLTAG